ncbi:MAG TPA: zinc metalloprotease HtpX [Elusimicrobiota bacterium]|nr:zinc metalloprotease HtpX [Elusimicrobiota bacterium]
MNHIKTIGLLTLLTLLFMFIGQLLGGQGGMVTAFIFAALMNMGSYWFSDKIVLMMYHAKPASENEYPQIYRILRTLVARTGMPMPRFYIIPSETPNAFATGRNPEHAVVACTEGILRMLNEKELAGVIAHELGHVQNRDILIGSIAATVAGAVMMLANMARWAAFMGGRSSDSDNRGNAGIQLAALVLVSILAPLAAVLIQSAISRSREFEADASGAKSSGDPLALASALKKLEAGARSIPMTNAGPATAHMFIVNPLSGKAIFNLFSTHPPIPERVKRLEGMVGRLGT